MSATFTHTRGTMRSLSAVSPLLSFVLAGCRSLHRLLLCARWQLTLTVLTSVLSVGCGYISAAVNKAS